MAYIQLIEITTSDPGALQRLEDRWRAETEGKRTVRRSVTCLDRDHPQRFVVIVEFDSYESAMENSNLEETENFAAELSHLADGPPRFSNLDVIRDHTD